MTQTHWDREWYLPFEGFRFHLVRLMDRVLHLFETQPGYRHFVTDGQTIMLEDYLEIRPEREELIRSHVKSARLVIGPWYILPDEYIVSGESLIRNLQAGRRVAEQFGPVSNAGYVPDPFGHVAQLPQILQGFGIDSFIFLRGMPVADKYGTEFMWSAPDDKSEVLAVWMKNIYFNASLLGYEAGWGDSARMKGQFKMESAMTQLQGQVDDLGKWTRTGTILLNNGCDHTFPQFEIPEVVEEANRHFQGVTFQHSTYDAFIADVKRARASLERMTGELRSSRYIVILPGVLSTRMYLKQWNRRCEALLERWAEPLAAMSLQLGGPDCRAELHYAWKLLLQNHPHDSICGCSTDAVHREMMTRFERVHQVGSAVTETASRFIQSRIDTQKDGARSALIVWNPLPIKRRGPMVATIGITETDSAKFRIVDESGRAIPFQVSEVGERMETVFLEFNRKVRDLEIAIDATAVGIGYQTFWLVEGKPPLMDNWSHKATTAGIETEHYHLSINRNGTFDLRDHETKATYRNLNLFEDTEDLGDEYDYSPAQKSRTLTTSNCRAKVTIAQRGPVYVDFDIVIPWKLPASGTPDRKARTKQLIEFTIHTRLRVFQHHRRIEIVTRFNNSVRDHRLRVHFDGPREAKFSQADGHFAHIRRPFSVKTTAKHDSPEPTTHHMRHFVALADKTTGLAILNRELTEYEILLQPDSRKTIAITLIRGVQYLSKDDLLTRKSYCGPQIETPEAQCLGAYQTEYAILPFAGDLKDVVAETECFSAPVTLSSEGLHEGDLPGTQSFIQLEPDHLVWSAWKPAEKRKGSVVRFYNPTSKPAGGLLKFNGPFRTAATCDMKENQHKASKAAMGASKVNVGKFEIVTYRVEQW